MSTHSPILASIGFKGNAGPKSPRWNRKLKVCGNCTEKIWVVNHKLKTKNFCTKSCFDQWQSIKGNAPMWGVRGEKHPRWKGGTTETAKIIKQSFDYRNWRLAVFRRDDWTCKDCSKKGGHLHAHHIKPFALFPELRCKLDNGLTLCRECHKKTDTYGKNYLLLKI